MKTEGSSDQRDGLLTDGHAAASRWAKPLMALQSAVSLAVVGLVLARAVNILGT